MTNEVVAKKRKPDEFLTDEEALVVLRRAVNQRKDSIEQFTNGGRAELAEPEQEELAVIETLLPRQMTREEIEPIAKTKLAELESPISPAWVSSWGTHAGLEGSGIGRRCESSR